MPRDILDDLRAANEARSAEWSEGEPFSLSFKGLELCGEVGELANCLKKIERERLGKRGSRTTMQHTKEELADAYICLGLGLVELELGITPAEVRQAIRDKFNATSEKVGLKTRLVTSTGETE